MNLDPTWHMNASKSNLLGLQVGDSSWPQPEGRRFAKSCCGGCNGHGFDSDAVPMKPITERET
jgi:hypothetical protein